MANYQRYRLNDGALVWATSLDEARDRWQGKNPQPANGADIAPFPRVQGPAPVQPPRPIQWQMPSAIPISTGDEAGAAGGVVSGLNVGRPAWGPQLQQAHVVFLPVRGAPPPAWQGGPNHPAGAAVAPSQTKVMVGH